MTMNTNISGTNNGGTSGKKFVDRTTAGILSNLVMLEGDKDLQAQARHVYFSARQALVTMQQDYLLKRVGEDAKIKAEGVQAVSTAVPWEITAGIQAREKEREEKLKDLRQALASDRALALRMIKDDREDKYNALRHTEGLTSKERELAKEKIKLQAQAETAYIREYYRLELAEKSKEIQDGFKQDLAYLRGQRDEYSAHKEFISDRTDDLFQNLIVAVLEARNTVVAYGEQVIVARRHLIRWLVNDYRETVRQRRWVSLDEDGAIDYMDKMLSRFSPEDELLKQFTDKEKLIAWTMTAKNADIDHDIIQNVKAATEEQKLVADIKDLEYKILDLGNELRPLFEARERLKAEKASLKDRAGVNTAIKSGQKQLQRWRKRLATLTKQLNEF